MKRIQKCWRRHKLQLNTKAKGIRLFSRMGIKWTTLLNTFGNRVVKIVNWKYYTMRIIHKVYSTITGASPPRQHAKCTITGSRKIKSTQRLADCNRSAFTEVLQRPVFIFHPRLSFYSFLFCLFYGILTCIITNTNKDSNK